MLYHQCLLTKFSGESTTSQTTYVPEKFAKVGLVLRLRDENKNWTGGWVVRHVGGAIEEEKLPNYRKEIRQHRKSTGDPLRKENYENPTTN